MGNGVYFKMIGCCNPNKDSQKADVYIDKYLDQNNHYIDYKDNHIINNKLNIKEIETRNKNENKIIFTKSKHSSGSGSIGKAKQIYNGENTSSNNNPNASICNNTLQMNNSNFFKNNLISNNLNNKCNINPIDELRHKSSIINFSKYNSNLKDNILEIKTKLFLNGDLFGNKTIEINKYGMKNSLRQRHDGLTIFGIKDNNENQNYPNCDCYFDFEKYDENNNNIKITGKVFEIYLNKKDKKYTLYFLHNSLILYYKVNNEVFFDLDKDYYMILGDIFLTIHVKKKTSLNEKIISIQAEVENEKPKKHTFTPKDMPIKIGRVNCDINIKIPSISKLHSMIDFTDDNFFYKDCGSMNGSTLLIREDDSLRIRGIMNFKLEDISFKIKEVADDNYIIEEKI